MLTKKWWTTWRCEKQNQFHIHSSWTSSQAYAILWNTKRWETPQNTSECTMLCSWPATIPVCYHKTISWCLLCQGGLRIDCNRVWKGNVEKLRAKLIQHFQPNLTLSSTLFYPQMIYLKLKLLKLLVNYMLKNKENLISFCQILLRKHWTCIFEQSSNNLSLKYIQRTQLSLCLLPSHPPPALKKWSPTHFYLGKQWWQTTCLCHLMCWRVFMFVRRYPGSVRTLLHPWRQSHHYTSPRNNRDSMFVSTTTSLT